jgi:hypothetical protein
MLDGLGGRRFRRRRACTATVSQSQQSRPPIERVGTAIDVTTLNKMLDQLRTSLLRHSKVLGDFRRGRIAAADADEGEPVCWTNIIEPAAGHAVLNPVHELGRQTQYCDGCVPLIATHRHILTGG